MTESEWLTSADPDAMLKAVGRRLSARKKRLFACACCRRILHLIPDARAREALEVSERFADSAATRTQLAAACSMAWEAYEEAMSAEAPEEPFAEAVEAACGRKLDAAAVAHTARLEECYAEPTPEEMAFTEAEWVAQAELLRDLVGNPFRPTAVAQGWRSTDVLALAREIYAGGRYEQMSILADALEDAGCADAEVLRHCRGAGPHVRGCWVVDGLLEKR
jgi:hypothetical protein